MNSHNFQNNQIMPENFIGRVSTLDWTMERLRAGLLVLFPGYCRTRSGVVVVAVEMVGTEPFLGFSY